MLRLPPKSGRFPLLFIAFLPLALLTISGTLSAAPAKPPKEVFLLNVSYDPTRELYKEINSAFSSQWESRTGQKVTIRQSHGGSGKQARSVMDGLGADVVTLALGHDIDMLAVPGKRLDTNWQSRLPHDSTPLISTIVFVVRMGNPKGIRDWSDLIKPGVEVITPNPKTSGGARWSYLAAYGYGLRQNGGNDDKAREFVTRLYKNVPVLDTGARGATTTFMQRKIGDVLLSWENEALLALKELGPGQCEIVWPSVSIQAEPPVAVVDRVTRRKGTAEVARAYLEFLFSEAGQEIGARHHFRPRNPVVAAKYKSSFPPIQTFTLKEMFGTWASAHARHFAEDGVFDRMYHLGR